MHQCWDSTEKIECDDSLTNYMVLLLSPFSEDHQLLGLPQLSHSTSLFLGRWWMVHV